MEICFVFASENCNLSVELFSNLEAASTTAEHNTPMIRERTDDYCRELSRCSEERTKMGGCGVRLRVNLDVAPADSKS